MVVQSTKPMKTSTRTLVELSDIVQNPGCPLYPSTSTYLTISRLAAGINLSERNKWRDTGALNVTGWMGG